MKGILTCAFLALFSLINGQNPASNIVPNGGFEFYSQEPKGWYYSGKDFSTTSKFWTSPTSASPDLYGPEVQIPKKWRQKGFGKVQPFEGQSFAGMTIYGCDEGKPHCREYIQIQLIEPLVPNQSYEISMQVNHLSGSYEPAHLGIFLGGNISNFTMDTAMVLKETTLLNLPYFGNEYWKKIKYTYKAKNDAEYLTVGNFKEDRYTSLRNESNPSLPFSYIYLDDVSIVKVPPILPIPVRENDLKRKVISKGKVIRLQNLYFDLDKAEFLPRSYTELNALYEILKSRSTLDIEIIGHTDNSGKKSYNEELSLARAKAVYTFLISKGISSQRLSYSGRGDTDPIAINETAEGRRRNRRVEFLVLAE